MTLVGASGIITLHIVAPINASKVAKVNNLAWRARQNEGIGLKLNPELRLLPNQKIAPVISLSINF